jgi:hypothetical protein
MSKKRQQIDRHLKATGQSSAFADGFDEAIIGVEESTLQDVRVVYDLDKCIDILVQKQGIDEDLAEEHLHYNVLGNHIGDVTPIFIRTFR